MLVVVREEKITRIEKDMKTRGKKELRDIMDRFFVLSALFPVVGSPQASHENSTYMKRP